MDEQLLHVSFFTFQRKVYVLQRRFICLGDYGVNSIPHKYVYDTSQNGIESFVPLLMLGIPVLRTDQSVVNAL